MSAVAEYLGSLSFCFQGFGEYDYEQNNFREQREIFLGSWGDLGIIFRGQGSTDTPAPHPCGVGGGLIQPG